MRPRFTYVIVFVTVVMVCLAIANAPVGSTDAVYAPEYDHIKRIQPDQIAAVDFADRTLAWGVRVNHLQSTEKLTVLSETLGSGICVLDFNKDGWMDLFFIGGSGHTREYGKQSWWHQNAGNRLLENVAGRLFRDVTESSNISNVGWGMGCAVADLDNDGWTDLVVTGIGSNSIYRNDAQGHFDDVTAITGVGAELWSMGASVADFNRDGLLDIYLSNYIKLQKGAPTFERQKGFAATLTAFDATLYDPLPNRLYINRGEFRFEEAGESMGVANPFGRSVGAAWFDINGDDWQDLIVMNDVGSNNRVFINDQGRRFDGSDENTHVLEAPGSHAILIDDFNHDGSIEYLLGRTQGMLPLLAYTDHNSVSDISGRAGLARQSQLNLNNWGLAGGDFNNDGHTDVFIANGATSPDMDAHAVAQAQPNQLYLGRGDSTFLETPLGKLPQTPLSSRAAVSADLNNDGVLELIVTNNNDPLQIFENKAPTDLHWLGLDLSSLNSVPATRVTVTTDQSTRVRTLSPVQAYLSQADPRVHMGLNTDRHIQSVSIRWQDGSTSMFNNVAIDQYYAVDKAGNSLVLQKVPEQTELQALQASLTRLSGMQRLLLARILMSDSSILRLPKLITVWESLGTIHRRQLLSAMANDWHLDFLVFLQQSLNQADKQLRLDAIALLRRLELEPGVAWLIPLIDDPDHDIRCASADAFRFFFSQEEAVTHRKQLAVTPLIKALLTRSAGSACIANALASAENERALLPLMQILGPQYDTDSRVAAASALGLVRDTRAISTLRDIVMDPAGNDAALVATALVALKRLNEPDVDRYLIQIITDEETETTLQKLRIVNQLLQQAEGLMFNHVVQDSLDKMIHQALQISDDTPENGRIIRAALNTIRLAKLQNHTDNILPLLSITTDRETRLAVYLTLLSTAQYDQQLLQSLSNQRDAGLLQQLMQQLDESVLAMPAPMLTPFIEAVATSDLMPLFRALNRPGRALLLKQLARAGNERMLIALNHCNQHPTLFIDALPPLPEIASIRRDLVDPGLKLAYVHCLYAMQAEQQQSRQQSLKTRVLLKEILDSEDYDSPDQLQVLLAGAEVDAIVVETLLLSRMDDFEGRDQLRAVSLLNRIPAERSVELLWRFLRDTRMPVETRLTAALGLIQQDQIGVADYIQTRLL